MKDPVGPAMQDLVGLLILDQGVVRTQAPVVHAMQVLVAAHTLGLVALRMPAPVGLLILDQGVVRTQAPVDRAMRDLGELVTMGLVAAHTLGLVAAVDAQVSASSLP